MASHPAVQEVQYRVSTSEVDIGRRLLLVTDPSGRVLWRTTRELVHDEIVESVMDSTGEVLWTIHKPIRGWYLVIRSPCYSNPGTHIALQPLKLRGPTSEDRFIFRLKPFHIPLLASEPSSSTSNPRMEPPSSPQETLISPIHSAPMSFAGSGESLKRNTSADSSTSQDPSEIVIPPSSYDPNRCHLPFDDSSSSSTLPDTLDLETPRPSASQSIPTSSTSTSTQDHDFLLRPAELTEPIGAFGRLLTFFGEPSKSFCCSRTGSTDVFSFEDQTSMFNLATKGELKIWLQPVEQFRMPITFWVTIALAYLGFRGDKEAYLAATEDIQ